MVGLSIALLLCEILQLLCAIMLKSILYQRLFSSFVMVFLV
jgi:hypothetical protein